MNRFLKIGLLSLGIVLIIIFVGLGRCSNIRIPLLPVFGSGIQDFSKDLPGGYKLYRNSSIDIFIVPDGGWDDETAIIPSKILKMNTYKNFIVAEREEVKNKPYNDSLNHQKTLDKDFWILDTGKNYVLKNLPFHEYIRKLDSLKIPRNIELIDVYEY
ncbi:DUF3997 domain-containing protein [Chryseobacterium sp. BIGb0232]|uniref:DUF3997 domain-containing protein n=1 Tax=Chryseobacterium sp. BIGb0232 TaxID=2940598 RepID=UPI000FAEEC85|nr:DUF3997 domain-containing protein [Chryseobacterium sp. BIGb0232]MCS4300769.1 hypothetical protein [Chryseobacterium sp. BIGb0232]ROS20351.1 uncharacterized protein DUF3997 [Chryseobacterium nakagawai]